MRDCGCGDVSQRIRQTVNVTEVVFGGNGPGSSLDSQKMQNNLCRRGELNLGLKVKEDEPEQSRKAEALVDFPQSHFMSILMNVAIGKLWRDRNSADLMFLFAE